MFTFQEVLEQAILNGVTEVPVTVSPVVQGGVTSFSANIPAYGWGKFSISGSVVTSEEGHWTFPAADSADDCGECKTAAVG
jgi:hypothetical protein